MLDVRRLRLLRELAHRGTVAAVAQALVLTPSAVSQQLAVLEREAGVPLLERHGRRLVLTPAARTLVDHTEAVLQRLEQASADLLDARSGLAGPLRIGTFPTAARSVVPGALVALAERHPRLEPMVSEIDPAHVADALRVGDLDVALVHEYDHGYDVAPGPPAVFVEQDVAERDAVERPTTEPGIATEPLWTEPMYLASPATADPVDDLGADPVAACRDRDWITATSGTLCHAATLRACRAAGFAPRVRHRVDEFATVLALVAAGQGVALVPRLALVGVPETVAVAAVPIHRHTHLAFRRGARHHPAVEAVAEALRDAVPGELRRSGCPGERARREV